MPGTDLDTWVAAWIRETKLEFSKSSYFSGGGQEINIQIVSNGSKCCEENIIERSNRK